MSRFLYVSVISLSLLFNGCTVVGFGIGVIVDKVHPDHENILLDELESIDAGEHLTIYLLNNHVYEGKYVGISPKKDTAGQIVPFEKRVVIIKISNERKSLQIGEIAKVELKNSNHQKFLMAARGFTIDLTIALAIGGALLLIFAFLKVASLGH